MVTKNTLPDLLNSSAKRRPFKVNKDCSALLVVQQGNCLLTAVKPRVLAVSQLVRFSIEAIRRMRSSLSMSRWGSIAVELRADSKKVLLSRQTS